MSGKTLQHISLEMLQEFELYIRMAKLHMQALVQAPKESSRVSIVLHKNYSLAVPWFLNIAVGDVKMDQNFFLDMGHLPQTFVVK